MTLPPDLQENAAVILPRRKGAMRLAKHGRAGMHSQDGDNKETFWPKKEVNLYCPNMYFLLLKKSWYNLDA